MIDMYVHSLIGLTTPRRDPPVRAGQSHLCSGRPLGLLLCQLEHSSMKWTSLMWHLVLSECRLSPVSSIASVDGNQLEQSLRSGHHILQLMSILGPIWNKYETYT